MIDVTVMINGESFTALCTVRGPDGEFEADTARLRNLPLADRQYCFDADPKYWRVITLSSMPARWLRLAVP